MSRDPRHDNIGSVLRWESYLAKEKSIDRFSKMLSTAGDTTAGVSRAFMAYMDELMQKGDWPDLDAIFVAYMQVRWAKLTNIHKILAELKIIIADISRKYAQFNRMATVIRQQLIQGRIPYIKVDDAHRQEFCRKLADAYFPSSVDETIIGSVPIQPPPL